jgi:hypothetical protein
VEESWLLLTGIPVLMACTREERWRWAAAHYCEEERGIATPGSPLRYKCRKKEQTDFKVIAINGEGKRNMISSKCFEVANYKSSAKFETKQY